MKIYDLKWFRPGFDQIIIKLLTFLFLDIDECTTGSHTCDSTVSSCLNTEGSYQCSCKNGYQMTRGGGCMGKYSTTEKLLGLQIIICG